MIASRSRYCTQCGMPATDEHTPSRAWVIGIAISLGVVAAFFSAFVVRLYGK
jgi:hypothetical protein